MNTLSLTNNYDSSMLQCIIFCEFGWQFIFIDTKMNKCVKNEDITKSWLKNNNISEYEFTQHCWNEYYSMKEYGVEFGLISFFSKDDEKVYNFAKTIDVVESYNTIFNC